MEHITTLFALPAFRKISRMSEGVTAFRHRIQTYFFLDDGGLNQIQRSYSHTLRNMDRGKVSVLIDLSQHIANARKRTCGG